MLSCKANNTGNCRTSATDKVFLTFTRPSTCMTVPKKKIIRVGSEVSQNPVTFTTESTKQWEPFLFPKWVINTPCSSLLQRERSYLTGLVGLVASQISPKSEPSAIPNSSCFILPSTLTNRGVKQENGGSQQGALSCRCDQETKEALGNSTQ